MIFARCRRRCRRFIRMTLGVIFILKPWRKHCATPAPTGSFMTACVIPGANVQPFLGRASSLPFGKARIFVMCGTERPSWRFTKKAITNRANHSDSASRCHQLVHARKDRSCMTAKAKVVYLKYRIDTILCNGESSSPQKRRLLEPIIQWSCM